MEKRNRMQTERIPKLLVVMGAARRNPDGSSSRI